MQKELANIWKKDIIKDLERRLLNSKVVKEFIANLKEEFGEGNNETMKVAELKKVEQEEKIIEKFIQKFRRVVRESEYKERLLIEEFK